MEMEELGNIRSLLNHVDLLIKKNDELLDATGARFNMFGVCGVNHYENTHSAIITEFLKPKGSHGMGSLFLEAFFKVLLLDDDFKIGTENRKISVKTEVSFNNVLDDGTHVKGRMDILITDGTHAICIENKIYAVDQYEQLQKYEAYLEKEYKGHWKIYYLTLGGYNASDDSADGVTYTRISYSKDIVNWLEECIKIAAEKPMLRETLCQYRNHIKNLTGTSMEKKYMNELIDLIGSSSKNYSSAQKITGIFDKAQETIINKKLDPILEELRKFIQEKLGDDKIDFFSNVSKDKYCGFKFYNESWSFRIRFEFQAPNYKGFICGIAGEGQFILPEDIPSGFDLKSKAWPFYKSASNLWDVEKLLFGTAEETDELLEKYKDTINEILPIVKNSLELQKSISKT